MEDKKIRDRVLRQNLLLIGVAAVVILMILSRMGYSDGDDAFFYQYATSMRFGEYLRWRYENWVGRMAGEALVYLTFNQGLWFWRIINTAMILLLPLGVLRLCCKVCGYRGYLDFMVSRETERESRVNAAIAGKNWKQNLVCFWNSIRYVVLVFCGYLLMNVMTVGYAAIWVNGSIFYTWTFTAGIWAMMPLADAFSGNGCFSAKQLIYAIPCSIIASMSIEQMGAVLVTFEFLTVFDLIWKKKRVPVSLIIQVLVTAAAFFLLFHAPGNAIRVEAETANWMPGYPDMTFGQHIFITLQWMLASFAKESRTCFIGIWIIGILLMEQKKRSSMKPNENKSEHISDGICEILAVIFSLAAMLPYGGCYLLQEMGIGNIDIEVCLLEIPTWAQMTVQNRVAFFWWAAAVCFTIIFLWKVSGHSILVGLTFLGGIASEAILFFSPTMYASGARVYYLTDWMYLFLMLWMLLRLEKEKQKNAMIVFLVFLGMINLIEQYSVVFLML